MYDALIAWLYDEAELSHDDLVSRFDSAAHQKLKQLVDQCLIGQTLPPDLSAKEFAHWIHDLRSSERDWNRSLGNALLKAEELHAGGDQQGAITVLEQFAAQCSWIPLRDIAEGEAQRHAAS